LSRELKDLETFKIILMDRKSKKNTKIYMDLYFELKTFNNSENKFKSLRKIVTRFGSSKLKSELNRR